MPVPITRAVVTLKFSQRYIAEPDANLRGTTDREKPLSALEHGYDLSITVIER
jgi:hypothetical protein